MSAERPLRGNFSRILEVFVPPLRGYRVKAEQARRDWDIAYYALGDEKGENVTGEQIRAVLNAHLEVIRALPISNYARFRPYFDKKFFEESLKLHTLSGLRYAQMFMSNRADFWRDVVYRIPVEESISGNNLEAQRRVKACNAASRLLSSIRSEISQ